MDVRKNNFLALKDGYKTSAEFASAAGLNPSAVSLIMKGKREIGELQARKIERALGLPLGWMDEENPNDAKQTTRPDPLQGYSFIQQYDNALAAGHSAINEFDNPKDALAFKSEWLKRKGLNPDNLVIVYATGDSMEPVIREKDVLMIDTSQKAIIDGKIYGFTSGDGARVKQLFQKTGGGLKVCSLNKAHYDEDLTAEEAASINIIGRVVWCGGEI